MTKSMKRIHTVNIRRDEDCMDGDTIGISAVATISLLPPDSSNGVLLQHISSGGLWGIDSRCDDGGYLDEFEQEQLAELRAQLHAIGFSQRTISAAFRNVTRE